MLRYFKNRFEDNLLLAWTYIIIIIGILLLFSTSKGVASKEGIFLKQILWVLGGTGLIYFIKNTDYKNSGKFAPLMYFSILLFLIIVLFFGKGVGGASRWIKIGWFNFQPSEFAKLVVIITLSAYLSEKDARRLPVLLASIIIVALPFLLVLQQPDLGTSLIFVIVFFAILYQAGAKKSHLLFLVVVNIFLSPFFWFAMKQYQKERILTFLNPMRDPLGKGYNLIQSIITIGSGGLFGKGYLKGTQTKLAFLPEYHTDFIFCVMAEEFGFIGVLVLLSLYYIFFKTIIDITYSTHDRFGRLLGVGILAMFISHVFVNIGMTMGLFPVVGIPLPFISYGGSSIIVSLMSVMLLVNIQENSLMF